MIPLVAVSGPECVDALVHAGFSVAARGAVGTTLASGLRRVVVPDVAMLRPEELVAILRAAGVSYGDFLDHLSEAPTDPAISAPTSTRRKIASGM